MANILKLKEISKKISYLCSLAEPLRSDTSAFEKTYSISQVKSRFIPNNVCKDPWNEICVVKMSRRDKKSDMEFQTLNSKTKLANCRIFLASCSCLPPLFSSSRASDTIISTDLSDLPDWITSEKGGFLFNYKKFFFLIRCSNNDPRFPK
jgi:hypothetical protein